MNSLITSLARLGLHFELDSFYSSKTADGVRKKSRCFQQGYIKISYRPKSWPTKKCDACQRCLKEILAPFDIDHPQYVHGPSAVGKSDLDPVSASWIRQRDPKSSRLHVADVELFGSVTELHSSAAGGCASCRIMRQRLLMVAAEESLHFLESMPIRLIRQRFYRESGGTAGTSPIFVKAGAIEANLFGIMPINQDRIAKEPDINSYKHVASVDSRAPAPLALNCAGHGIHTQDQAECIADHLRSWLDVCSQGHKACRGTQLLMNDGQDRGWKGEVSHRKGRLSDGFLPTRLLAIQRRNEVLYLRLVETTTLKTLPHSGNTYYTALSYSWGKQEFDTTNAENIEQRRQGFGVNGLAKTFKDAVVITYEAGISYLWIDAFCIIQSDNADVKKELGLMHLVYSHARFTIAAATAESVQQGCIFEYPMRDYPAYPCRVDDLCGPHTTIEGPLWLNPADSNWRQMVASSTLTSRGWCFQERILSTRIVHCTTQGVFWECRELEASDYYPGGKKYGSIELDPRANEFKKLMRRDVNFKQGGVEEHPHQLFDASIRHWKSLPENEMLSHGWLVAVERFSHREFGRGTRPKPEDKLPAILGLVKSLEDRFMGQDRYLAGVWKSYLAEGLCWAARIQPGSQNDECQLKKRIMGRPSWSWTSIQQPISFHVEETRAWRRGPTGRVFQPIVFENRVRILSVDSGSTVQVPTADKYDVTTITLKGRMIDLDIRYFSARHQRSVTTMAELDASFNTAEDQALSTAPSQAGSNTFRISAEGTLKIDDIETSEWLRQQNPEELHLQCLRISSEKSFPWSRRAETNVYLVIVPVEGSKAHTQYKRIGRLELSKPFRKQGKSGNSTYHEPVSDKSVPYDSDSQMDEATAQVRDGHSPQIPAQHTDTYTAATMSVFERSEQQDTSSSESNDSIMIDISDWENDRRRKLEKQSHYQPPTIEYLLPEDFIEPGRDVVIELI